MLKFQVSENIMNVTRTILCKKGLGHRVNSKTVTYALARHIERNRIPVNQVSMDTGIAEEKLLTTGNQALTASEFLDLCVYLGVKPEELQNDDRD